MMARNGNLRKLDERADGVRAPDAEGSRRNILDIATEEFAEKGFSGARIDEIAARTNTSKRMIYYYFTDKDGLFVAVLEEAYRRIRTIENSLDLDHLSPEDALKKLVGFTFDYQNANPDFIRLVMVENIHNGVHLQKSRGIRNLNVTVIDAIERLYERGVADGVFRKGLDPIHIHMSISALSFFNVSNRATFSLIFDHDMTSRQALAKRRAQVVETILRYMAK
ncbi:MAG: TetR family transcriptional regulator [Proteobacteria bacterium]|nr:TetR family transcriptional regulator [Pseudomonadota bacterium]MBI3498252.1 TetR family transcriptional regulator [Pseudomonadota bacterium]